MSPVCATVTASDVRNSCGGRFEMGSGIAELAPAASLASSACRNCAGRTTFEQPPCPDGHGQDCPEWYCTECGAATIVGRHSGRRWRKA